MSCKPYKSVNIQSIYHALLFCLLVFHCSFKSVNFSFKWCWTSRLQCRCEWNHRSVTELFVLSVFCLPAVFCLGSIHPVAVNQSLAHYSAANAALQNPGVCGLASFKSALPTAAQTDTANPARSMREQAPHINNLLFRALNQKRERKAPTVGWSSPKTNSLD